MANSTPLLQSPSDKAAPPSPPHTSVDSTIECCSGAAQIFQALLISFAWFFDAQQTFIAVFTDAMPAWHCTTGDTCPTATCSLPEGSWSWDNPPHTSVISEWSLQCSSPAILGLPASAYFVGCLAGGFLLATLADSLLGRKNMLIVFCATMSAASALSAAAPNLWAYAAFRFACGFARSTVGTSSLVLATETIGRRWRDRISVAGFFFFTVGFISLPVIAYLCRGSSWRTLYLWTSLPCLLYSISLHYLIHESPRWLLVRGRRDEAIETLNKMAMENGKTIRSSFPALAPMDEAWNVDVFSALKILWERRWAFRRLVAMMVVAFGVGIVYYGMPLNVGNLGSDLYLSVAINALAELPSALVTFFMVGMFSRRGSSLVFTTVCGVFSLLCVVVENKGLRMAVEVVSFFCACTAYDVLLVYSVELFPTCVRNSAISMVRQAFVLGGVFAPVMVAAGREARFWSFGLFGLMVGFCGLFVACLPETWGRTMSDTMEEEEVREIGLSNGSP